MWGTVEILFTVPGQLCPRCVLCVACGKVGLGTVSALYLYRSLGLWDPEALEKISLSEALRADTGHSVPESPTPWWIKNF